MAPVIFSVRYKSTSKSDKPKVIVRGYSPKGDKMDISATIQNRPDLPVEKMFIKQQLDLLSAQLWFKHEERKLKERVVELSVAHSIPVYGTTTLLTFEARKEELKARGIFIEHWMDVAQQEDLDATAAAGGASSASSASSAGVFFCFFCFVW